MVKVYFLAHGGLVQGVGYRYFARKSAIEHQITGWVRNTDDDKVEGEAQGSPSAISSLLRDLDKGPTGAHVARLDKKDIGTVDGETAFEVRR